MFSLTSRLTRNWSEDERRTLWALGDIEQAVSDNGNISLFGADTAVDFQVRGIGRHDPVARILWISIKAGILQVEAEDRSTAVDADRCNHRGRNS